MREHQQATGAPSSAEPHDLTMERAILGSALLYAETVLPEIRPVLAPRHCFRRAHQVLLETMYRLADAGEPVDFLRVRSALEQSGGLHDVGGVLYLSELTDGVPRSVNVGSYAAIVVDLAARRTALAALASTAAGVRVHGATAEVLDPLRNALQALDGPVDLAIAHERRVIAEAEKERARRAARRLVDSEEHGSDDLPPAESLDLLLAQEFEAEQPPRIVGWQPHGGRVLFAAPRKTGKTTAIGNYVRCCADGDPWLGAYPTKAVSGSVVVIDLEMQRQQLAAWLRDQRIRHTDKVHVVSLRGRVGSFNILTPAGRQVWAARLRDLGTDVLVFDCLRPALDALGLDENRDAGKFLAAFDALLAEGGVLESVVVHHFGHAGERSRGDSRIEDQADAIWKLVRQDDDPRSQRFISAYGRDIDVREQAVDYDPVTRRLVVAGGSRKDAAAQDVLDVIVAILVDAGRPLNGLELKRMLEGEHSRNAIDGALKVGRDSRTLRWQEGPKGSKLYSPGELPRASREFPGKDASVFPAPYKGREAGKDDRDGKGGGDRVRI